MTPLKDRIGTQIVTHYPTSIDIARAITEQEANIEPSLKKAIHVPEMAKILLEQIVIEARSSELIDEKSGVSARMSISTYENLISTAHLRMLKNNEATGTVRLSDFQGIIPSITGKVELVYEGEQEGSENVALILLGDAIKTLFTEYFTHIKKLAKADDYPEFDALLHWFVENPMLELSFDMDETTYDIELNSVTPLKNILNKYQPNVEEKDHNFMLEFILWAMVEYGKLDKRRMNDGLKFQNDLLAGL